MHSGPKNPTNSVFRRSLINIGGSKAIVIPADIIAHTNWCNAIELDLALIDEDTIIVTPFLTMEYLATLSTAAHKFRQT